jgi:hypothetical protein
MKYQINKYQAIYSCGSRDSIKLESPIYTNDVEAVRTKLKNKHTGFGKQCVSVNLDYVELNIKANDIV